MSVDLQRKRDLGKILDDAFAVYRAHWRTLLAIALVVVVPVHLIVYGAGLGWLWEGYDTGPQNTEDVKISDLTDSLIGLAAQLLVVTPLVTAMTVHVVRSAAAGRSVPAGEAIKVGFDAFGRLFPAVLLVALGVGLGLLALIVPGVILAVRWAVVSQIVVVEDKRGTEALQRSFELTRGQGFFAFLVLLVTNLLVGVLSAIALLPLEYAAKEADAQAISLAGGMLGAIIALPILAVAQTLLYYTLVVIREGAPAPTPLPSPLPGAQPEPPPPPTPQTQTLPGVPGTFGDGFAPPRPPDS